MVRDTSATRLGTAPGARQDRRQELGESTAMANAQIPIEPQCPMASTAAGCIIGHWTLIGIWGLGIGHYCQASAAQSITRLSASVTRLSPLQAADSVDNIPLQHLNARA